jgi:hypothetical protein
MRLDIVINLSAILSTNEEVAAGEELTAEIPDMTLNINVN